MTYVPKVRVEGAAQKIEQIYRFDKDIWKEVQQGVRAAMKGVVTDTRANYPNTALSNWGPWIAYRSGRDLSFDGSAARSGVRAGFRSKQRRGVRVISGMAWNKTPAGAIYELAGSQDRSGEFFNRNINKKRGGVVGSRNNGMWPRALGPAWTKNVDAVRQEIGRVVERAVDKVNR